MTAIKVAVLKSSSTEDYRRVTVTVMCLPTASSGVRTASLPGEFLIATLTVSACPEESPLYLVLTELVVVGHREHPLFDVESCFLIFESGRPLTP
jgi:hypothetical protein